MVQTQQKLLASNRDKKKKICLPAAATVLKECTKHQTNEFFSCFLDRSSLSSLGDDSDSDKLWCNPWLKMAVEKLKRCQWKFNW